MMKTDKTIQRLRITAVVLALAGIGMARPACAQVAFQTGNHPQSNEQNVLLPQGQSGSTVLGVTNLTGTTVDFSSTLDTLLTPANGQARIEAADGVVNDLLISLPGFSFTDLIANPKDLNGTLTLTVKSSGGIQTFTTTGGNGQGQDFFTLVADPGVTINSVLLEAPQGFQDLQQVRVSGVAVPEPGTPAMLGFGLAGLGILMYARRHRRGQTP